MKLYYESSNELYHHGIKGMKWGKRRYRNADGSLTPAGRKRYSKQYEKLSVEVNRDLARNQSRLYVEGHNRAADKMNKGGIEKFNAQQRKKYGEDYTERDGYIDDYNKLFGSVLEKEVSKSYLDYIESHPSYKKAQQMVNEYGMTEWNEMARDNQETVNYLRKTMGS